MKRRLFGLVTGVGFLVLTVAGPVAAAPQPRIHDSGSVSYAYGVFEECNRRTCTYAAVSISTDERTGETSVCVDSGGQRSGSWGCAPVAEGDYVLSNGTATLAPTAVTLETCNRRGCTYDEVIVSASYTALGQPSSYSRNETYTYPDGCTERYRVRGSSAEASGTFTIDGTEYSTSHGGIGQETYNFSSTCVFEE